jgi:NAD/NADP transhydrogenase alpha subunit
MAQRSLFRDVLFAAVIVWLVFTFSVLHGTGVHSVNHLLLVLGACAAMVAPVAMIGGFLVAAFSELRRALGR